MDSLLRLTHKSICLILVFMLTMWNVALALPELNTIVNGNAVTDTQGDVMTIDASDETIINYDSFNIGANESVIINLPNSTARMLNRVIGPGISQLMGNLTSNGLFILINPNGIYIGSGAYIDAQDLILSTRDMDNQDFLDGNYHFTKLSNQQMDRLIKNAGDIEIREGGFGVLIAGGIDNSGTIVAPLGKIVLAAGDAVKLDIGGEGLISVAIEESVAETIYDDEGRPITDQIKNTGHLSAPGGVVTIQAENLGDIFSKVVNVDGLIEATHATVGLDGTISFVTQSGGDMRLAGELKAEHIKIESNADIVSTASILARVFEETAATFRFGGGTFHVGESFHQNLDNAIQYMAGTTDVSGVINDPDNIELLAGATVRLTGATTFNAGTDGSGAFIMDAASDIDGNGGNTLAVNSNDAATLDAVSDVGSLALGSTNGGAVTFDMNDTLDINGDLTIGANVILQANATTGFVAGGWTNNGTFIAGTSTITFDATSGTHSIASGGDPFYHVVVNDAGGTGEWDLSDMFESDGTFTLTDGIFDQNGANAIQWDGAVVINGGTFSGGSADIDVNNTLTLAGGAFTSSSGNLTFSSTGTVFDNSSGGTFNHNNGTVVFSGDGKTLDVNSTETFNHVTVNMNAIQELLIASGDTLEVAGTLLLTDGAVSTGTLAAQGDVTVGAAFDGGTASLQLTGTANQNLNLSGAADRLDLALTLDKSSGVVTLLSELDLDSDDLMIIDGILSLDGNDLTVGGTFSNDDTLRLQGGETLALTQDADSGTWEFLGDGIGASSTHTISGRDYFNLTINDSSVSNSDTFLLAAELDVNNDLTLTDGTMDADGNPLTIGGGLEFGAAGVFTDNSNVMTFDASSGTHTITSNGESFYDLAFNDGGGSATWQLADALDVDNDFTVTSGVFDARGRSMNVAGDFQVARSSFIHNNNSLTFDGAGVQQLMTNSNALYDAIFSSAGNVTLADALDVNNNFQLASGTLDANGMDINVAGDWIGSGGTFNAQNNTVYLDGLNQTISGSTTFYHFNKTVSGADTLTIESGTTQVFRAMLTLKGEPDALLRVISDVPDTPWNLDGASTNLTALSVRDSHADMGNIVGCIDNCRDISNNRNWIFAESRDIQSAQMDIDQTEHEPVADVKIQMEESVYEVADHGICSRVDMGESGCYMWSEENAWEKFARTDAAFNFITTAKVTSGALYVRGYTHEGELNEHGVLLLRGLVGVMAFGEQIVKKYSDGRQDYAALK